MFIALTAEKAELNSVAGAEKCEIPMRHSRYYFFCFDRAALLHILSNNRLNYTLFIIFFKPFWYLLVLTLFIKL